MQNNIQLLEELNNISRKHHLDTFYENLNNELNSAKVSIAILGEFSSGKSTLANAFLGKKILPALEKPTTASIVEIIGGDELKAFTQKDNIFEEIDIVDLGEYIMGDKAKTIDKVIIETKENDFIHKGFKIIDTPGISSINNTHDDITFGYLPFIDAALIVLNINFGGSTESLLTFLKEKILLKNQLSKIIFVLNHADTKSEIEIQTIKEELKKQLNSLINNPLVVAVSALEYVNGNVDKSNIKELKEILVSNLLKEKNSLLESRKNKILVEKTQNLLTLLSEKMKALSIDNSELDSEIEKIKRKITELQSEKNNLKEPLERFHEEIIDFLKEKSKDYSIRLLDASMNSNQDVFDNVSKSLADELKSFLNFKFKQLNSSIKGQFSSLPDSLKAKVEDSISAIRDTINAVSPIIMGLILAAFTGPIGIGAGEVVTESLLIGAGKTAGNLGTSGMLSKILPALSTVIKDLDVPNKIMKYGAKQFLKEDIEKKIYSALNSSISLIINELEIEVENNISEKVINPQKELENMLEKTREEKKSGIQDMFKVKELLEKDINLLKSYL